MILFMYKLEYSIFLSMTRDFAAVLLVLDETHLLLDSTKYMDICMQASGLVISWTNYYFILLFAVGIFNCENIVKIM